MDAIPPLIVGSLLIVFRRRFAAVVLEWQTWMFGHRYGSVVWDRAPLGAAILGAGFIATGLIHLFTGS